MSRPHASRFRTRVMIGAVVFAGLSLGGCPTDTGTPPSDDLEDQILDILERELDARGTIGPQGVQGVQGDQGSQGDAGPAGSAGAIGSQGSQGSAGTAGVDGANGADGADGQLRIYGDGSAGSKTISADVTLVDTNTQYANFTVDAGVTLTIPSGAVLRCTGTFTNNGTIVIQTGAAGSRQSSFSNTIDGSYSPAEAGISKRAASPGEFGDNTTTRAGGLAGVGISEFEARRILNPGVKAGGGSGGAFSSTGMSGGGSFTVLAMGAITNGATGVINADGEDSSGARRGGAGGGGVILASPTSVTNGGTITADGGNGGNNDTFAGVGGGGGGGIIHMLAPMVTAGTTSVAGGTAGAAGGVGSVSSVPHQGGGGGGASGGNGGAGGSVSSANTPNGAGNGSIGYVLTTIVDPTALF